MNKKIITALIALILIVPTTTNSVAAEQVPTIAILDTALNTSLPIFKDRITYEVCILEWNSCPNGKSFMEGPGSAGLPLSVISKNGFNHGTNIASIFAENTNKFNIVFVRIIGNTFMGDRQTTNEITIVNALDWVIKNKTKYNIQAVSMSQGHHNLAPLADYCPKTPATQNKIKDLIALNVPTLMAVGNGSDYKRVDWPACIDEAIGIGASTPQDQFAIYSNYDPIKTDFISIGQLTALDPNGKRINVRGTSASTIVAAAQWLELKNAKPLLTHQQILDLFTKTSLPAKSSSTFVAKLINLTAAING